MTKQLTDASSIITAAVKRCPDVSNCCYWWLEMTATQYRLACAPSTTLVKTQNPKRILQDKYNQKVLRYHFVYNTRCKSENMQKIEALQSPMPKAADHRGPVIHYPTLMLQSQPERFQIPVWNERV